jgi:hypothetical protein
MLTTTKDSFIPLYRIGEGGQQYKSGPSPQVTKSNPQDKVSK